jgi:RsiW-degrading membrane proteinase PrsW (M82 family)
VHIVIEPIILVVLALAPGIFWMLYFYHKDTCKPEPPSLILRTFLLGIAVTLPVAVVEDLTGMLLGVALPFPIAFVENGATMMLSQILLVAVVAPVVEEYGKYFVVRHSVYTTLDFDEPVDGIVYAAAAALGFATLENFLYVFSAYALSFPLAVGTGVIRAILSVPGHALFSIMWGYALGRAKFLPQHLRMRVIAGGLLLAMFFHGIFNFLLITSIGFAILILIIVPGMWVLVMRRIDTALGLCTRRV